MKAQLGTPDTIQSVEPDRAVDSKEKRSAKNEGVFYKVTVMPKGGRIDEDTMIV